MGRTKPTVIGHGGVPWEHLLANLDAAGYHGWITIDPAELNDRVGAVRESLNTLKKN
jgi:sugar phosphate isomerase/epimerase